MVLFELGGSPNGGGYLLGSGITEHAIAESQVGGGGINILEAVNCRAERLSIDGEVGILADVILDRLLRARSLNAA